MSEVAPVTHSSSRAKRAAPFVIMSLPIIWGPTFAMVQYALRSSSPMTFVVARFGIASATVLLFSRVARRVVRMILRPRTTAERQLRWDVVVLGSTLASGYLLQTVGLETTTTSTSAFLTSTSVIWTPLFARMLGRDKLTIPTVIAALAAIAGVFLLSNPFVTGGFVVGDALTIFSAMMFAIYIIKIERAGPHALNLSSHANDATMLITSGQLFVAAVLLIVMLPLVETPKVHLSAGLIGTTLYLSLMITVLTAFLQARFQPYLRPSTAAVMYMLEPVVAWIVAVAYLHERMGTNDVLGSLLIIGGVIVAQVAPRVTSSLAE